MPPARKPGLRYPRLKLAYFNKLINLTMTRLFRSGGLDVTREQEAILRELLQGDGINQAELAARTGQDRNNLSRTLDLLVRKRLAYRDVSDTDRRQSLVFLTDKGKALESAAYAAVNQYREILFAGFSQREVDAFALAIERLTSNLESFLGGQPGAR
ncbi:MAG: MarR family transcriptional regulator [Burkholderiales bacterium]|nr:MarR family transcriptional regulator [Burkholderiales bacterium]